MLWASQVAPGNDNALRIRVYGDKGGLAWHQESPDYLDLLPLGKPPQRIIRAHPSTGKSAGRVTRIPAGHVEGYFEGFATIYSDCAELITAKLENRAPDPGASPGAFRRGRRPRRPVHRRGDRIQRPRRCLGRYRLGTLMR